MTKKETKKKTKSLRELEEKLNMINESIVEGDATNKTEETINPGLENVQKALDNVEVDFDNVQLDDSISSHMTEEDVINKATEPIKEYVEECEQIKNGQEAFLANLATLSQEEAANRIQTEIDRVEIIKQKLTNTIEKTFSNGTTSFWNGMTMV